MFHVFMCSTGHTAFSIGQCWAVSPAFKYTQFRGFPVHQRQPTSCSLGNKDSIPVTQQPHIVYMTTDGISDPVFNRVSDGCTLPAVDRLSRVLLKGVSSIHLWRVSWSVWVCVICLLICMSTGWKSAICSEAETSSQPFPVSSPSLQKCGSCGAIIMWHQMNATPSPAPKHNPS